MQTSTFKIYNASAGSGKTFSLVKDFLVALFKVNDPIPFRSLLAITFTNKAVAEMKGRIISALNSFSSEEQTVENNPLAKAVCAELNISQDQLRKRSAVLLRQLVFNYSSFQISTIDKFNQNLIRVFSHELKLPSKFDVELDTKSVVRKAVDRLLSKTGSDEELGNALIDFALEKTDADKSFDIARDLFNIGQLLINENHLVYIEQLESKDLKDFSALRKMLRKQISALKKDILSNARELLGLIESHGLEYDDFSRNLLPNHFLKIVNGSTDFKSLYGNKLQQNIEENNLYNKGLEDSKKAIIDSLNPEFLNSFSLIKDQILSLDLLENLMKNSGPLSVLILLKKEMDAIQEEEEMLMISEFNSIISAHIKSQPVPFIYERIGEKFHHYFIDEFQDTSVLQWENLIPLIGNSLASAPSGLTLVGDAKQAIYRWRGGRAEQFIQLYQNTHNPFNQEAQQINLDKNFRSARSIVDFNNSFFRFISDEILNSSDHKMLYELSSQEPTKDFEGYVKVEFLSSEDKSELHQAYAGHCLISINNCLERKFEYRDICILVRKNEHGVFLANYLNEHSKFPILSSEALLLDNDPSVSFIISILKYLSEPEFQELQFDILNFLLDFHLTDKDSHSFFSEILHKNQRSFFQNLKAYNFEFNIEEALSLSLYELIEYIIYVFDLSAFPNAFLVELLNFAVSFSKAEKQGIKDFLSRYEDQKEKLSISVPEEMNAIRIMTIHKSKGLEFPVVIYPFADLDLHDSQNPKTWFELNPEKFEGFPLAYVNLNSKFAEFGDYASSIYEQHLNDLELDTVNLVYVAFTRAEQELHVYSNAVNPEKSDQNKNRLNGILLAYLSSINKRSDQQGLFEFGEQTQKQTAYSQQKASEYFNTIYSTPKSLLPLQIVNNASYLWDENKLEAVERGNLIHEILSGIIYESDLEFAFQDAIESGLINLEQVEIVKPQILNLINHSKLNYLFHSDNTVYNERDVIRENGEILRPDRVVVLPSGGVEIIDYKTGFYREEYNHQINEYARAYNELGFEVEHKKIVLINQDIEIIEI